MVKITETRKFNKHNLKRLCIDNEYYTSGTNEDYESMFDTVDMYNQSRTITNSDILLVAVDIAMHTIENDVATSDTIQGIMFNIMKYAVDTYFTVE